jgi:tryptophan synthase alpha chain
MNRLDRLFSQKQSNILNLYFTAGYPELEDTGRIIRALEAAGVDLIEVGMPYSDPLADGPTIQESGQAAIRNGMDIPKLFEQIRKVRQHSDIPLVLMGYFNPVMQYGEQRFFEQCAEAGVDGLILPDLPVYEYENFYQPQIQEAGLRMSFLITPQTEESRIRKIDALSDGFVYMVSDASITGAKRGISERQLAYFERIQQMQLNAPRLIGFGISDHESYSIACRYAQGAIIGSAFIRALAAGGAIEETARQFVNQIRQPISI